MQQRALFAFVTAVAVQFFGRDDDGGGLSSDPLRAILLLLDVAQRPEFLHVEEILFPSVCHFVADQIVS